MTTAYPLSWPEGFPRAKSRESGRFKTTLNAAIKNVRDSLRLFEADSGKVAQNVIISSNVTLGEAKPADPGVAIWFVWNGAQVCIPVDRYSTVEANLQAIHHVIEARRTEARHGGLAIVQAAFAGFRALPAPGRKPWREVLGLPATATMTDIDRAYRELAKTRHPDAGGSEAMMAELNAARDAARKEVGGG